MALQPLHYFFVAASRPQPVDLDLLCLELLNSWRGDGLIALIGMDDLGLTDPKQCRLKGKNRIAESNLLESFQPIIYLEHRIPIANRCRGRLRSGM